MTKRQQKFTLVLVATVLLGLLAIGRLYVAKGQESQPPKLSVLDKVRNLEQRGSTALELMPNMKADIVPEPLATDGIGAWSMLAFSRYDSTNGFDVFTAHGDGSSQVRRGTSLATDWQPKFNRGATKVAFVSYRDGNYEIYTMNANGSGLTRRTNNSASDYWPNWSPDGSKIVFYSYRNGNNNAEIYVMNADGTNQTRLTNNAAWDAYPAWSPDGTRIVFSSNRANSNISDLWIMNANGSNPHRLTTNLDAYYPEWSPDGQRIAFSDDDDHNYWLNIAIINVNGTGLSQLIGNSATYDLISPTFSPDRQHLAFSQVHYTLYQGYYYWDQAYVLSLNLSDNSPKPLMYELGDWWPNWQTQDISAAVSTVSSPVLSKNNFSVNWSGTDIGLAGIKSYDIQYKDGKDGAWKNWLTDTNASSFGPIELTSVYTNLRSSIQPLYIGARAEGWLVGQFQGSIDDVRIYNRVLTLQEVNILYNATSSALAPIAASNCTTLVTAGLTACYPFKGNANDASGHSHNGTVTSAVLVPDRFGVANSAYYFDGIHAFIKVPDGSGLNDLGSQASLESVS